MKIRFLTWNIEYGINIFQKHEMEIWWCGINIYQTRASCRNSEKIDHLTKKISYFLFFDHFRRPIDCLLEAVHTKTQVQEIPAFVYFVLKILGARSPYKIALSCWAGATKMQPVLEILFPILPGLLARHVVTARWRTCCIFQIRTSRWFSVSHGI